MLTKMLSSSCATMDLGERRDNSTVYTRDLWLMLLALHHLHCLNSLHGGVLGITVISVLPSLLLSSSSLPLYHFHFQITSTLGTFNVTNKRYNSFLVYNT